MCVGVPVNHSHSLCVKDDDSGNIYRLLPFWTAPIRDNTDIDFALYAR